MGATRELSAPLTISELEQYIKRIIFHFHIQSERVPPLGYGRDERDERVLPRPA